MSHQFALTLLVCNCICIFEIDSSYWTAAGEGRILFIYDLSNQIANTVRLAYVYRQINEYSKERLATILQGSLSRSTPSLLSKYTPLIE